MQSAQFDTTGENPHHGDAFDECSDRSQSLSIDEVLLTMVQGPNGDEVLYQASSVVLQPGLNMLILKTSVNLGPVEYSMKPSFPTFLAAVSRNMLYRSIRVQISCFHNSLSNR